MPKTQNASIADFLPFEFKPAADRRHPLTSLTTMGYSIIVNATATYLDNWRIFEFKKTPLSQRRLGL
ncbi:MAG: hypothetical protein ACK4P5_08535, partial [Fimbriimonadales bacterium]